jgi:hypothetical protein
MPIFVCFDHADGTLGAVVVFLVLVAVCLSDRPKRKKRHAQKGDKPMRTIVLMLLALGLVGCERSPEQAQQDQRRARIEQIRRDIDAKTSAAAARSRDAEAREPAPARRQAAPAQADLGKDAYYQGRRAVQALLKAPATAKFSTPRLDANTGWQPHGYQQWKVFGHVDAQNSFGALLREQWAAVVVGDASSMTVVWAQLGEQQTGPMPGVRPAPTVATGRR